MKYIINYTKEGKILGFAKGDTYLNIEVSNQVWFENQGMNKIIINGENISFDKVDWRTPEEISAELIQTQRAEAQSYLNSTDWYVTRKIETGVEIPLDISTKRAEARLVIN